MKTTNLNKIKHKICNISELKDRIKKWRFNEEKIVFTNGCFDLVHRGHIEVLANIADLGDRLIIALNTDNSIQKLKGNNRPIIDENSRSVLLSALEFVDAIIFFSEETPEKIIQNILPDILAKGGDYSIEEIAGHDVVLNNGGKVLITPLIDGYSTSSIIQKIIKNQ
tara:strand:+ start:6840 stop:7340 length:501 start_codon:yes stop_codon:yes gene_type:complete